MATAELRKEPDALLPRLPRRRRAEAAPRATTRRACAASPATCRRSSAACSITSPITRSTCPIPTARADAQGAERVHACATPTSRGRTLVDAIAKWWPDAGKRQARRERLADAFDEETAKASAPPLRRGDRRPTRRRRCAAPRRSCSGAAVGPRRAQRDRRRCSTDPSVVLRAKACEALGDAHAANAADAVAKQLGRS